MSEGSSMLPADITARTVGTPRLATHLLESEPDNREEAIPDCRHTPQVERSKEFRLLLFGFLAEKHGRITP